MFVATVAHGVADWDRWKAIYDETSPTLVANASYARVHRLIDDPGRVMTTVGFESLEELKGFLDAPELREHMERAGVTGDVEISYYELADETTNA